MRRNPCVLGVLLACVAAAGCGGDEGAADDRGRRDVPADAAPGTDLLVADDAGDALAHADDGDDPGTPDAVADDFPPPIDPGAADTPGDPGGPDDPGSLPDTGPAPVFCRSFDDCGDDEVCVFSLGACQPRATWVDDALGLLAFHPPAAGPGDTLVIDGRRFFTTMMGSVRLRIGNVNVPAGAYVADENRLLVTVSAGMKGALTIVDAENHVAFLPGPFLQAPAGVIPCDGTTPLASNVPGATPRSAGPYAAGYVDLGDSRRTRVTYPAFCGSVRRPPIPGTHPFVLILHGNGALHLNYEYLAELLATWGFVSAMPATDQNMAGDPFQDMLDDLMPLVRSIRGNELSAVHPVLAGVTASAAIGFVGHSRGTGRTEEVIGYDADIAAHTVGAVFLGPVDDGDRVPGQFLVFGGGKDSQSGYLNYAGTYNQQPAPRWMVELPGGNHGSFGDHKVYGYGGGILGALGDQPPTIKRHRQLSVVQSFALPLFQRAFGLDEPFASQLDHPPAAPDYKVTFELQ